MFLVLISSIVTTYTTYRNAQKAFETELLSIKESLGDGSMMNIIDIQKKIGLYKAFSDSQAIDTTRQVMFIFLLETSIISLLFLYLIFGITRPMKKFSKAVKSIYFDKNEKELFIKETGTEEVRVLIQAFNQMIMKLKNYEKIIGDVNKYRGWKEISRIIVHEINNIISPIQTYLEFLIDRIDDKDKINLILEKLRDMSGILIKFREISHLPDAFLEHLDAGTIVSEVCGEFKNVNFSCAAKTVEITADRILFKEILRNLIKNAVESGEHPYVETGIIENDSEIIFYVKDKGRGISPKKLSKIFDPGFTTKKGNIGIGLSIVRSLAQEQNAVVTVESEEGAGSTFYLSFSR